MEINGHSPLLVKFLKQNIAKLPKTQALKTKVSFPLTKRLAKNKKKNNNEKPSLDHAASQLVKSKKK